MQILKRLGLITSASLLKLAIFILATSLAFVSVFGTSDAIKDSASESGIYDKFVSSVIRQNLDRQGNNGKSLPLERPEIQAAAEKAFSPELLQSSAESFIDGFYDWLEGDTSQPEFRIDLTDAKQTFIQKVADHAEGRLRGLPACTPQQSLAISRQDVDPFTVKCRPPMNINAEKRRLIDELEDNDEFLEDTVLTAEDMADGDGTGFDSATNKAPESFQMIKRLPVILGVTSLLLGAAVILLSETKRAGIRRLGVITFGTGIFIIISTLVLTSIFNRMNRPEGILGGLTDNTESEIQAILLDILGSLHTRFNQALLITAGVYVVIGLGILLAVRFLRRKPEHTGQA